MLNGSVPLLNFKDFPLRPYAGESGYVADWRALSTKLPIGKDPASRTVRRALFDKFDVNGNGYLSLAEVDKAVRDVTKVDALFKSKPVVMRAFQAARRASGDAVGMNGDYVERSEFRRLLVCLRCYFELYAAFKKLDRDADGRVSLDEFRRGMAQLARWQIRLQPSEVDAEFARMDRNGGGMVLFDEFTDWAVARRLDLSGEHLGNEDAAAESPVRPQSTPSRRPQPPLPKRVAPGAFGLPPAPRMSSVASSPAIPKSARPAGAFVGKPASPRPTSARAGVGLVGWRGGGTSNRTKSSEVDTAEVGRRARAQTAVAESAAAAFARALPPAPPPDDPVAEQRRQAVAAVNAKARQKAAAAVTREQLEERAWSSLNRKIGPTMHMVTAPPPRHVPSEADRRLGKPSEKTGTRSDPVSLVMCGQVVPAGHKAEPTKPAFKGLLADDRRAWRCPSCHIMQRPSSTMCVSCTRERSGAKPELLTKRMGEPR